MAKLLSKKLFLESFKYSPRLAVCIVVKNKKGEALLTKRKITPFKGSWHYPGGFLLKGERISESIARIAVKEIGINIDVNKTKFLGIFENLKKDPRGHVIDVLYEYTIPESINLRPNDENQELCFYKKMPNNIAFGHREVMKKIGYD